MTGSRAGRGVRIAVVDHGAGNLVSIGRALERAGATVLQADGPEGLVGVDGIVLPGVGAMASVMDGIRGGGFEPALRSPSVPLLGICVGMQVLFAVSEEDDAGGLGLIDGTVRRLEGAPRLPHIGWNDVTLETPADPLWGDLGPSPLLYFVHSYAPDPVDQSVATARCEYGKPFVAAVRAGRVWGTQFHPERSGHAGLRVLANFVDLCRRAP